MNQLTKDQILELLRDVDQDTLSHAIACMIQQDWITDPKMIAGIMTDCTETLVCMVVEKKP